MENKTVLITGGNAGIGKETAVALAKKGAHVVIVCRNADKGQKALIEIKERAKSSKVDLMVADLASLEDVRRLAKEFHENFSSLDVLINNAGCITDRHTLTKEAFELQFGVNHLAHFLLTHLLLDFLKASEDGRIVNVSSSAHYRGSLDFDSLQGEQKKYKGIQAYRQSKLCNVLFTRELARQLKADNITANALHPGVVRTMFGNKTGRLLSIVWTIMKLFAISEARGAKTSVYLASSPTVKGITGQFFDENQKEKAPSAQAQDDELAKKLWAYSLKATGLNQE